jgi:glycosyltransferase GT-like protein
MLTSKRFDTAHHIISPRAFFQIVLDALQTKKPLSVVRMGDGERLLMDLTKNDVTSQLLTRPGCEEWMKALGLEGITKKEIRRRLLSAERNADYFAPSVTGLYNDGFNLYDIFPKRKSYVDNFFVNDWEEEMKIKLFKEAGHVLLIHANPHTADSMQLRVQANLGVKVEYIHLSNWSQSESVIDRAAANDAPLVLFSGGPACKYIGYIISRGGYKPKVVLDLGNAADHWTFSNLPIDRPAAEAFHAQWVKNKT